MAGERSYTPLFVSAKTLAFLLDCSESTIGIYEKQGLIPKSIKIGNLVRWDWDVVAAHIREASSGNARADVEDDFLRAIKSGADKAS